MKNIVIIGATSAMAKAVARLYALEGNNLMLLARNEKNLALLADDLRVRGAASVNTLPFDAEDVNAAPATVEKIFKQCEKVDVVLIAHGSLPDQTECQTSTELMLQELSVNGLSCIALLTEFANKMESQKQGSIAVITSVAGVRGRQSNYVYGAAKGMVSIFMEGLAQRLAKHGIHVLDIKPGFVDTPMTKEFDKGALWAQPEDVAKIIKHRIEKKRLFSYVPFFWWGIMTIIRFIPARIFNKLSL